MERVYRSFHYVVFTEDLAQHMINFTENDVVEKFAYIRHFSPTIGEPHYHFYFKTNRLLTERQMDEMTDVFCRHLMNKNVSSDVILHYLLVGCKLDIVDLESFRTNIDGYKKYNGISRINNKNGV